MSGKEKIEEQEFFKVEMMNREFAKQLARLHSIFCASFSFTNKIPTIDNWQRQEKILRTADGIVSAYMTSKRDIEYWLQRELKHPGSYTKKAEMNS